MKETAFFQSRTHYFPHIPRLFTARVCLWIVFGLFVGGLASYVFSKQTDLFRPFQQQVLGVTMKQDEAQNKSSYAYWKDVIEKRPDYRDGYLMAAWYAQKLEIEDEARVLLQKATTLDPTFPLPDHFQQ